EADGEHDPLEPGGARPFELGAAGRRRAPDGEAAGEIVEQAELVDEGGAGGGYRRLARGQGGGGDAVIDKGAVGAFPGDGEGARARGGEEHRARPGDPGKARAADALAGEEGADRAGALGERRQAAAPEAEIGGAAVAAAEAEDGAARRDQVERGDRRGRDRRVARQQVADAQRDARPRRRRGDK